MTDIMLRDIDEVLAQRIGRIGESHGWSTAQTLLRVLETGLNVCEGNEALRLAEHESGVLQAAIAALEQVPDDSGFALIGRAEPPVAPVEPPDQSIPARFALK